jgi:hypothetical protein
MADGDASVDEQRSAAPWRKFRRLRRTSTGLDVGLVADGFHRA